MKNKNRQMPENPTNVVDKIMKSFIDACDSEKENIAVEDVPDIEISTVKFVGKTCQINIPREWIDEMGITADNPQITLMFDGDTITARLDLIEE